LGRKARRVWTPFLVWFDKRDWVIVPIILALCVPISIRYSSLNAYIYAIEPHTNKTFQSPSHVHIHNRSS
jgi:hypothetical protein